jgi:hypothetical protein
MKGKNVRFSVQEDEIIVQCVRNMPNNLQMAFEQAASLCQRKTLSIQGRYYMRLRYAYKMFYIEHVGQDVKLQPYIMVDKTIIYNVKNLARR